MVLLVARIFAVVLVAQLAVAQLDHNGLPTDMAQFMLIRPPFPGMKELFEAATTWSEEASDDKGKAEKIIEDLTKAADAPHDIFAGLRVFATSLRKAVDSEDADTLKKALGMREKFLKSTSRFSKKCQQEVVKMTQQAKAKQEAEKQAAAKLFDKPPKGDAGSPPGDGDDVTIDLDDSDDMDHDPDLDVDDAGAAAPAGDKKVEHKVVQMKGPAGQPTSADIRHFKNNDDRRRRVGEKSPMDEF